MVVKIEPFTIVMKFVVVVVVYHLPCLFLLQIGDGHSIMKKSSVHQCERCQANQGQNSNNNNENCCAGPEDHYQVTSTLSRAAKKLEDVKEAASIQICQCGNKNKEKQQQKDFHKSFLKQVCFVCFHLANLVIGRG